MKDDDFESDFDPDDDAPELIMALLSLSAEWLVAVPDSHAFVARMAVD